MVDFGGDTGLVVLTDVMGRSVLFSNGKELRGLCLGSKFTTDWACRCGCRV